MILDCHDHHLNCLEIARQDEEVDLRAYAVSED
jgi:hypothetical protein